jgi:raffinose/stachyose/melibiose transport system substrate-binding protein
VIGLLASCVPAQLPPAATPAPKKVTLTTWDPSSDEGINKIFADMDGAFMQRYPHITIERTHVLHSEYKQKLDTAFAGQAAPDIVWAWANPSTFYAYVDKGLVVPLDDAYTARGWTKYFPPAMLAAAKGKDGRLYGVPDFINGTVIAYNVDIFAKYNLQPPSTWDEWLKVLDTLKANGVTPIGLGASDGNWQLRRLFELILNSVAGKDFTEALYRGEKSWESPEVIDALERFKQMDPYLSTGYMGMDSRQGWAIWYAQQAAMMVSDTWQFGLHDRDAEFRWDFFFFPKVKEDNPTNFVGAVSDVMYIPTSSPYKEEAILYLDFFLTKEAQAFWVEGAKLPFVPAAAHGLITEEKMGPQNVKLLDYINTNGFTTWFDVGVPVEVSDKATPAIVSVIQGKISAEEAAREIESAAKEYYKK